MSTALPEPLHLEPEDTSDTTATRHLRSVPEQKLTIRQVSRPDLLATVQRPQLALPLTDPADEYAPQQLRRTHHTRSNVVSLHKPGEPQVADRWHVEQREAIKKMTQTIAAAFVEAELGIRPFRQLSSWIEMELFQKLRARVERTVSGNHLVAKCNKPGVTSVPSITPIAVRAEARENGDWETSMTIRVGQRARAVAMRLSLRRERWKVTAFEIG
ncbi:MAG TPA: hypothetical protein H9822_09030 [Candidatus Yaniella excrementavium]|nr:hypothetical protein [Candidatus Yaniella excrementavium]